MGSTRTTLSMWEVPFPRKIKALLLEKRNACQAGQLAPTLNYILYFTPDFKSQLLLQAGDFKANS